MCAASGGYGGFSRSGCGSSSKSAPDESNRLFVASHGRSLAIGDFLPPAGAPRAGGDDPRSADALAQRAQPFGGDRVGINDRPGRLKAQHFLEPIEPRRAAGDPARGAHRTLGEDRPVGRAMD